MIQDYELINGRIIVCDDKVGFKTYENQSNIDEVLITENSIEKLNELITKAKFDKIEKQHKLNIKFNKKEILSSAIMSTLIFAILSCTILYFTPLVSIIITILGTAYFNFLLYHVDFDTKKSLKNEINAHTLEIEQLEKLLKDEEKRLEKLKNKKTEFCMTDKNLTFKERNTERLQKIDELKRLYKYCGYFAKKLIKYQQKGILKDKLDDSFSTNELAIIENLVKEKCPQLVKRKKIEKPY